MKRVLSLVLVMFIFWNVGAKVAIGETESFSIRNGITFGDNAETVKRKEVLKIDKEILPDKANDREGQIITKSGKVAGIDSSSIKYYFGYEDSLNRVDYSFAYEYDTKSAQYRYDMINEGLIKKYGDALGYRNGECFIIQKGCLSETYSMVENLMPHGLSDGVLAYDEWVVGYNDYNIKIEHIIYSLTQKSLGKWYVHVLSYTTFSEEELINAMQEKQDKKDEVAGDL